MNQQQRLQYKAKLKEIETMLQDTEDFLIECGVDNIRNAPLLDDRDKIFFPRKSIRHRLFFTQAFQLNSFINSDTLRRNISYSLQSVDLFNYFNKRMRIGLATGKIFLKLGMVNIFSIIESILYGAVEELHKYCMFDAENQPCKHNLTCPYYLPKPYSKGFSFAKIIRKLCDQELIRLTEVGRNLIHKFQKIRDNIHLFLAEGNELNNDEYTNESYTQMIQFLIYLRDNFHLNIARFKQERRQNCTKEL